MAPMTRSRAINNVPNDLMALYYELKSNSRIINYRRHCNIGKCFRICKNSRNLQSGTN
ncbi:hypothetical protein [Flavobacterium sp. 2755]|uniref:hypothetical protein n=1 Tax=Flavobacterium sp. 2755 TaxID=2817765 RepID=UPI00286B609D|nr:hypothetical protein [Flavobacterium sp. 2755]